MAGNTEQARRKMPPMSPFEQEVLVNIVDSFKSVVENKKNDISKKGKAWSEIQKQFCSIAGVIKRDRDQLKTIGKT